jgi:hypothetical protein
MAKVGKFATLRCKLSSFCVDAEVLHIGTIHCQSRVPLVCVGLRSSNDLFSFHCEGSAGCVHQVRTRFTFSFFFVVGTKGKSNFLFWIHMGIPSPTESPPHKIGVPRSYAHDFVKRIMQMFQYITLL